MAALVPTVALEIVVGQGGSVQWWQWMVAQLLAVTLVDWRTAAPLGCEPPLPYLKPPSLHDLEVLLRILAMVVVAVMSVAQHDEGLEEQ